MRIVRLLKDIIVTSGNEIIAYAPGSHFFLVYDVSPTSWILEHVTKKNRFYADPNDFVEVDLNQPSP